MGSVDYAASDVSACGSIGSHSELLNPGAVVAAMLLG